MSGNIVQWIFALMIAPMQSQMTSTQGQYLAFIYAYTRVLRRPPAEADIQKYFEVTPPTVHQMLITLERKGLIRRTPGVARSIELLIAPDSLPVLR
jgi:DNA-binding MarR family transcriptional regulator